MDLLGSFFCYFFSVILTINTRCLDNFEFWNLFPIPVDCCNLFFAILHLYFTVSIRNSLTGYMVFSMELTILLHFHSPEDLVLCIQFVLFSNVLIIQFSKYLFTFLFFKVIIYCSITVVCIFPQPNPPPFLASLLPAGFVYVSLIVVPKNPSPHYPLPPPLRLLSNCS